MTRPLSILLLADDQKGHPNTIHDHIQAFSRYSRHRFELFNPRGLQRSRFLDLGQFDVVVIHYSLVVIWDDYLAPAFRGEIARYRGLKVQFLQDEYRWVDEITAAMNELGIDVLYSIVPPRLVDAVYGGRLPRTQIVPTLTGYVPDRLLGLQPRPLSDRLIEVGYRGRSLPYWLGRLGHEKIEIGRAFLERAAETDLRCDIAWTESARIYGDRWNAFMSSSRAMLASESGSSIIDYDGSVERAVQAYLARHPTAPYEEVEEAVLRPLASGPVMNTVSPRLFEAAAHRTAMVMFPGEYAGVVQPWEHYLPLEKDLSNFDEIVGHLRDLPALGQMVERAYGDVIASGSHSERTFIQEFDETVAALAEPKVKTARYPRRRLQLEQLAAGRSYHVSTFYALAREFLLAYIGVRQTLRHRQLLGLASRARRRSSEIPGATRLWDDIFRLAVLTSVHRGVLEPSVPFALAAAYDPQSRRLTLTSRPPDEAAPDSVQNGMSDAVRKGGISELVWNHAAVGQFVALPIPGLPKRVAFDVGRYDAYAVYRFEALARLARDRPDLVLPALMPLLTPAAGRQTAYGFGAGDASPRASANDNEAGT